MSDRDVKLQTHRGCPKNRTAGSFPGSSHPNFCATEVPLVLTGGAAMAAVTSPVWRRAKYLKIPAADAPRRTSNKRNSPCSWLLSKGIRTRSRHPAQRSWKELQFLPTSFVPSSPVVLLVEVPAGSVSWARGLHSSLPCQGCSLSHLFAHFSERCHFSLPPSSLTQREGQEKT